MTGEISHQTALEVDWQAVTGLPDRDAANALRGLLASAEGLLSEAESRLTLIRERIFNVKLCAFRIISERELWKLDVDPEYGVPFKSMHRWLSCLYPNESDLRYAIEANTTQKALPAATLDDLGQMKRVNAVMLASQYVSDTCKRDPEMIAATKTASEKQFREKLNRDHGQHIEAPETRKWTLPLRDWAQIDRYLEWIAEKAQTDPEDKPGTLLYLAIHELEEMNT